MGWFVEFVMAMTTFYTVLHYFQLKELHHRLQRVERKLDLDAFDTSA